MQSNNGVNYKIYLVPPLHSRTKVSGGFTGIENPSTEVFLGILFMTKTHASLDFGTNKLQIPKNVPVHTDQLIEIAPFLEIVLPGGLRFPLKENTLGDSLPFPPLHAKGSCWEEHLSCYIAIKCLCGCLMPHCPSKFTKGEKVAMFEKWPIDLEVFPHDEVESLANLSISAQHQPKPTPWTHNMYWIVACANVDDLYWAKDI